MLAVGAGIGGAVTAMFGRNVSFIVDSASFLLSAFFLSRMRVHFSEERGHHERPPLLESIRETVRFAREKPRVLGLLTVKGGYGLGAGVVAMVSVFGREVFHAGAFGIGVFAADYGFVTLTMAISSLGAGLASDHFGPFVATVSAATLSLLFGIVWSVATWRLWRR